ncbi:MAG: potassium transporter KefB [Candidatus Melainabacteria bacterium HGW-Melainabacteria-1]|nr:MAG: potassium transporter KefB [Candidatus Melainabacteria bacterium HGW-Melainabacteria-1]
MEIVLFKEIVLILAISAIVVLICQKFKIPSIVGFLLTGTLAGPHGLALVNSVHEVEMIAEIGVIFLLFTIGIEFSIGHLLQIKRSVLLGGATQVLLTLGLVMAGLMALGQPFSISIFAGCMIALSSTAIVLKLFQQRQEMDSPHGKTVLGILIFQDLAIVPMMLLTPLMAGKADNVGIELLLMMLKFAAVAVGVLFASKWLMPKLLYQVVRTRNNELFLLAILATCMVIALGTASIGLSLSLGAFLAGLVISESEYSHQAMSNILPFRDIFISFFFVSIGMLLNGSYFLSHWPLILAAATAVILLKLVTGFAAGAVLGYPPRTALLASLALCQVGEFAFVLSKTGLSLNLLEDSSYQLFLAVSILTMALTPLLIAMGPRTAVLMNRVPGLNKIGTGRLSDASQTSDDATLGLQNHLIIIGFGLNGQNLANVARASGIPYVIVETNAETVKRYQAQGEPIHYGDATSHLILEHLHIERARVAVIAISDRRATEQVIHAIRSLNGSIELIVRTRFVHEVAHLYRLGADIVIPEEFETSIEIFARVLQTYLVPEADIDHFVEQARADGYSMLRSPSRREWNALDLPLSDFEISTLRLDADSELVGLSLVESALRQRFDATLLAIRRGRELISQPDGQIRFEAHDVLVMLGKPEGLRNAAAVCHEYVVPVASDLQPET